MRRRSHRGRTARAAQAALLALTLAAVPPAARAEECLRGVNLAGAEFGKLPGRLFIDYTYPDEKTLDYFAGKGFNAIRLPVLWERLQPRLRQPLDAGELAALDATLAAARARGLRVVLDPHNYARYRDKPIGSKAVPASAFADFWRRLALHLRGQDDLVLALMNEPYAMAAKDWLPSASAALEAIRKAGLRNLVLVPGTLWTGAHSWEAEQPGGSNAAVMGRIRDPANNIAFEVHQYLDSDFSGSHWECSRGGDAKAALERFTDWLRRTGNRGFLGEFGTTTDAACLDALGQMVSVMNGAPEMWTGWTYWAGGGWWGPDYPMSIQPDAAGDRPQMTALAPLVPRTRPEEKSCASLTTPRFSFQELRP